MLRRGSQGLVANEARPSIRCRRPRGPETVGASRLRCPSRLGSSSGGRSFRRPRPKRRLSPVQPAASHPGRRGEAPTALRGPRARARRPKNPPRSAPESAGRPHGQHVRPSDSGLPSHGVVRRKVWRLREEVSWSSFWVVKVLTRLFRRRIGPVDYEHVDGAPNRTVSIQPMRVWIISSGLSPTRSLG